MIFKTTAATILDLLSADLDHPQRALGGLYRSAKFGWNQCSSSSNIKFLMFCTFENAFSCPWGAGFHPLDGEQYQQNPKRQTLLPVCVT